MDNGVIEQMNVWEVLSVLKMDIKVGENAGRSDKIFYQHMCEGMEENNLDKMYEFINAMEWRCGLGREDKIYKLMKKAFEEDSVRLGKMIATHDYGLWKRWIEKNEYNIKWQRIVGEVLIELPPESLIAYAETIYYFCIYKCYTLVYECFYRRKWQLGKRDC